MQASGSVTESAGGEAAGTSVCWRPLAWIEKAILRDMIPRGITFRIILAIFRKFPATQAAA